jgi:hypothetical protein
MILGQMVWGDSRRPGLVLCLLDGPQAERGGGVALGLGLGLADDRIPLLLLPEYHLFDRVSDNRYL